MKITFHINYRTEGSDVLVVSGNTPELGNSYATEALTMQCVGGEHWQVTADINTEKNAAFSYKYAIRGEQGIKWEWGKPRVIHASVYPEMDLWDFWRPNQELHNSFHASAFTRAIMKRKHKYESSDLQDSSSSVASFSYLNMNSFGINKGYPGLIGFVIFCIK